MKKLFIAIKNYLSMDVRNEEESKDLAILLRVMSGLYMLFFLAISIILCFSGFYALAIIGLVFIGLSVGTFIATYEGQTNKAMQFFTILSILASFIYTCIIGWRSNMQWLLLISIMVVFFTIEVDMKSKMNYLWFSAILLLVLTLITHILPLYKDINQYNTAIYQFVISIFYSLSIGFLAFRYCIKFNETDEKLRETNNKLKQMASIDALTQLINRRQMNENLSMEVFEFTRNGTPFVIAIADVDFFKKVNDSYGHDTGDYVLKELAIIFMKTMEGRGSVARWGGEEFLFCFEKLNGQKAVSILDNMRKQVESHNFFFKEQNLKITITIGVEEYSEILGLESTISNADQKLYVGKTNGRNRVIF